MGAVWSREVHEESDGPLENPAPDDYEERKKTRIEEMERFKEELRKKREARHDAIQSLNTRIAQLTEENERVKKENETLKHKLDCEESVEIDSEKKEELEELERQIKALKDVAIIGGDMLKIREQQVNELKAKLAAIEETGLQYEKEVENMRRLRDLYEERSRAVAISHQMEIERERARVVASDSRKEIAEQQIAIVEERNKELEERVSTLDTALDAAKAEISDLKLQLAGKSEDLYNVSAQMDIVNQLFGQVLSPGDSVGRVTRVLEEHHDLVNHLTASGKINDLASTLLNLAENKDLPNAEQAEDDVASHLSKVWKLLVELLGHHVKHAPEDVPPDSCYKSVETPSGPKLVISVSQTFLRLKDLILEKNSLVKEVGRLKDLNTTLEHRLVEQESRLAVVAAELHTTWGVVNKLKSQHKQLHTHEKVLRYELAQKRNMLKDLKRELEECKENWALARAKNTKTEEDWKVLRTEFASRKQQISSAESGYEESPSDSQDEEDNWKEKEKSPIVEEEDPCKVLAWDDGCEEPKQPEHVKEEEKEDKVEKEPAKPRTAEEILDARQARLQRLEEQCKGLFSKMSQTSQRSDIISSRLVELHEQYGDDRKPKAEKGDEMDDAAAGRTLKVDTTEDAAAAQTSKADEMEDAITGRIAKTDAIDDAITGRILTEAIDDTTAGRTTADETST
ncbi:kinesin-like protein KIF20B [Cimex lectularius]|uniref:Uncharacterized protein n=1 Tax=Cimex lectularius TaxID=79782 RepID=A0A8I6RD96_CIMLE|nr:kinesin-like protein KIF20B [Cimex lectularius]